MDTYVITGGRSFGDISDKAQQTLTSEEYKLRFEEYKWVRYKIWDFYVDDTLYETNLKFVFGDASGVDYIAKDLC